MTTIQDIPLETINGDSTTLGDYAGSVLLLVNVASKCGLTPQYEALQALYQRYRDEGLVVMGFPANDFMGQEPGTNDEIAEFCSVKYAVDFPMFAKISVLGDDKHPLYAEMTTKVPLATGDKDAQREIQRGYGMTPTEDPEVLWNFEKFLVDRQGQVVERFAPMVEPNDPALVGAVERELGKS